MKTLRPFFLLSVLLLLLLSSELTFAGLNKHFRLQGIVMEFTRTEVTFFYRGNRFVAPRSYFAHKKITLEPGARFEIDTTVDAVRRIRVKPFPKQLRASRSAAVRR